MAKKIKPADVLSQLTKERNVPKLTAELKSFKDENGDQFIAKEKSVLSDRKAHDEKGVNVKNFAYNNTVDFMQNNVYKGDPAAVNMYNEYFLRDQKKVYDYFEQKACDLFDYEPLEFRNSAWENKLFSIPRIQTKDDQAFVVLWRDLMKAKWAATGSYKNDIEISKAFFDIFSLTIPPVWEPITKL